jgi:hypothetical protein
LRYCPKLGARLGCFTLYNQLYRRLNVTHSNFGPLHVPQSTYVRDLLCMCGLQGSRSSASQGGFSDIPSHHSFGWVMSATKPRYKVMLCSLSLLLTNSQCHPPQKQSQLYRDALTRFLARTIALALPPLSSVALTAR